jgi:hypothetical protein
VPSGKFAGPTENPFFFFETRLPSSSRERLGAILSSPERVEVVPLSQGSSGGVCGLVLQGTSTRQLAALRSGLQMRRWTIRWQCDLLKLSLTLNRVLAGVGYAPICKWRACAFDLYNRVTSKGRHEKEKGE